MTIKEIARRANVSLGTVDRVLHNRGKVSKETKEKVLKIIEEVNYKPNFYARGLVLNKSFNIAALVPEFDNGEYWELPYNGIMQASKEFNQFGINIKFFFFDQNSISSFVQQAQNLIESRPDGVILAPVINFEAVKLCSQLKKLNIPFTLIDSKLKNTGALSFIGQDANRSGRLAAKLLVNCLKEKGNLLIVSIKNNENHNDTLQKRKEGFQQFLLESPFLEDVKLEEINIDQRDKNWRKKLESTLLEKKPDGIYVPSSKVHYVAKILNENEISSKLIGNDLIRKNSVFIESGVIGYVIGQRPNAQGYLALENFYKYLVTGQDVEKNVFLPLDIITKENLDYYGFTNND